MKLLLILTLALLLSGCGACVGYGDCLRYNYGSSSDWLIVKDIYCDNNCTFIKQTLGAKLPCQKGNRIMKVYPIKTIYIYCTNPATDIGVCEDNAVAKLPWWERFYVNYLR